MAATQAEPQQNDVNREIVQQEQPPLSANNSFQNGTDNSNCRAILGTDVVGVKGKKPIQNNISVDMSQYRQESGPPVNNSEQNVSSEDSGGKINNAEKSYQHNSEQSASDVNFGKGPPEGSQNMQGYGLPFPQRGNYVHPDAGNPMHMGGDSMHHQSNSYGHFNPNMRHPYPGSKPVAVPTRPPSGGPIPSTGFPPHSQQQRFMSGQSISPPTGPTPTLNQLLQSSNSAHRYQNSYSDYGMGKSGDQVPQNMGYNQNWPPPRPMAPYPQQPAPYRNQAPPGGRGYSGGSPGGGGPYPPPPSASPSGQYPPQPPYRHPYQMPGSNNGSPYDRGGSWSPGPQQQSAGAGVPPPPVVSSQQQQPQPPPPPQQQQQQQQQSQQPGGPAGAPPNCPPTGQPPQQPPQQQPPPPPQQQQQPPQSISSSQQPPSPSSHHMQANFQNRGPTQPQHQAPGPGSQPPPQSLQQHTQQGEPSPQATNTHGPDAADLTGQNSNDSSSGGGAAPGTPNSQGMRPTPSPTGSSGSRSMSPAVGQQNVVTMPPRPSSGQSDSGNGPTRMSHSPMTNQVGYPAGGPHMHNYKMAPHQMPPHPHGPPQSQQIPPYSPQPPHQYPQQGNYGVRLGGYGQGYGGPPPGSGMPGGPPPQAQYPPPRPLPNHVQYPPSPYQHKVAYGSSMPPSPGSYNSHGGGSMGPPQSHQLGMPPPPPPHHDGPMPPPPPASTPTHDVHDSTITTTAPTQGGLVGSGGPGGGVPPGGGGSGGGGGSVTSIVTTGPDGASLDEASQQSTLSNASAASGDDTTCTPAKSRKEGMVSGYHSHPTTPQSTAPSPGAASLNSMHEEYPPDHSPTWPRTPASPKQHDSLGKLYEMDDSHERRLWLDKLLHFMDERGTPITVCPTISKNPLDLFRLYLYVKERGGFMEVCKVTKNKVWKDIAGLLGIGASSSAAYTLRKHYTKNLLPYECHFDRGGIDPQPIISQVEATSKKKGAKAAPVPSPGSSNSQDSFPGPGSASSGMDGYGGYGGYPQDYNSQPRPPSQSSQGVGVPATQVGGDNISVSNPFDDHAASSRAPRPGMPPSGGYPGQASYQYGEQYNQQYSGGSYPANRPIYPPYGPEPDSRVYNQSNTTGNNSGGPTPPVSGAGQGPPPGTDYRGYLGPGSGAGNSVAPGGYPPPRGYPPQPPSSQGSPSPSGTPPSAPPPPQGAPPPVQGAPPPQPQQYQGPPPPPPQDYYRQDPGVYPGAAGGQPAGYPQNKTMPPPAPQPRRHPDFVKEPQPYPPYNQQRPNMYPGWSNNNNSGYRGQYPGAGSPGGPQQWGQGPSRPGAPPPPPQTNNQWPPPQPPYQSPQTQQGWGMGTPGVGQGSPLRPPLGPRPAFRPDSKPYNQMPPHAAPQIKSNAGYGSGSQVKRELVFPMESIEATTPVLYKRRRLGKNDVTPVDAWRIMMALKSGLLAETTWGLDMLNILLFDDSTIAYFGLVHLPGLMDILLEHMRRSLSDMLDPPTPPPFSEPVPDLSPADLGAVDKIPDPKDRLTILKSQDYTLRTRKGHTVTVTQDASDIFVTSDKRPWDADDTVDDASLEQDSSKYIIACFRAEFGRIPFVKMLSGPNKKSKPEVKMEEAKSPTDKLPEAGLEKKEEKKVSERTSKKKTKTLSDVLSRIKKESVDTPPETKTDSSSDLPVKEEPAKVERAETPERKEEDMFENKLSCRIRDPAGTLKRRRISDYEDECYTRDEASLYLVTESQDALARRCVCLSTILRNLTFVPGNESEFAKSGTFLGLVGKLLLLHHEHPPRVTKQRNYDREEEVDFADCCSSLQGDSEWWWEFLHHLRENALVSIANISGHVDLGLYPEDISRPILDGLLHWAVCPAAQGQDPFPTVSPTSSLSPQRLALEALCKLCVTDANVDLVIATPPYCRLERLAAVLTRLLCRSEEQVLREFAVNLLYYLGAADSGMARTIAMQSPCVSQLVAFIEQAEQSALGVANQHGLTALRDNPDCMGTSLDMLRRAARTLLHLSKHPDNWPLFLQQEQRLLALVMSQILDQQVASIISMVLFQVSRAPPPQTPPPPPSTTAAGAAPQSPSPNGEDDTT
ncbi:trithorax group protein osa isoform X3 [Rhodnius prolixus]|uniref:trithorax group protein osa isoform X3 n=1 Tax=Rhodnius prolixus TaxID=13249 RepID=UPI003D18C537